MSASLRQFKLALPNLKKSKAAVKRGGGTPDNDGEGSSEKTDARVWATGHKLRFLQSRIDAWKEAGQMDDIATFYDNVTAAWIAMWGWDLPADEDAPPKMDEPTAQDIEDAFSKLELTSAEAQERRKVYYGLRARIQRWFRHHGRKSLKAQKADPIAKILADFTDTISKAPRRVTPVQFYQRMYHEQRIKQVADKEFQQLRADALAAGHPPPAKITVVNQVALRMYNAESQDFKDQLERDMELDFRERMAAYEAVSSRNKQPSTPEEYHAELQAAGHWLNAFAEHVAGRLGMNVSVFLAGPIGENGGEIGVRCVHVGKSSGIVPKLWPDFDEAAFNVVSKSMIRFAHACFSPEQCRARALPGTVHEDVHAAAGEVAPSSPVDAASSMGVFSSVSASETPTTSLQTTSTASSSSPRPTIALPANTSSTTSLLSLATVRTAAESARSSHAPGMPSPLRHSSVPVMHGSPMQASLLNARRSSAPPPQVPAGMSLGQPHGAPPFVPAKDFVDDRNARDRDSGPLHASTPLSPVPSPLVPQPPSSPSPSPSSQPLSPRHSPVANESSPRPLSPSAQPYVAHSGESLSPGPRALAPSASLPSSASPPPPIQIEDSPAETSKIVTYLVGGGGWGARWQELVATYVAIERHAGFQPRGRLPRPTQDRPGEVAVWMKYARQLRDVHIEDVDVFAQKWSRWWKANVDALRHELSGPTASSPSSWMQLAVTGPSGLVLFLLSAAWWGAAVLDGTIEQQQAWLDAVEDMLDVFKHVLHALDDSGVSSEVQSTRKRAGQTVPGSRPKKQRT
ncbi:hypothetical protein OH77DRAFT_1525997 [Trametes cingulata]|nr:hypothetical protein OH77DRAFT_1525997 [Trametes cingulata]